MSSSRRKSSKSSGTEEDKKQRGRPRVEPQDETPQDRRRTQIRLAQRAYRQRKEVTITALRQRATELKGVVNQMSDSFAAIQHAAFAAGVETTYPALASQMRSTSAEFGQLVRTADQGIDEILDGEAPGTGIGTGLPHGKRNSDDDSGNSSVDGGHSSKRLRHDSSPPLEQYDASLSSIWGYTVLPPLPREGGGQQMVTELGLEGGNPMTEGTADRGRYDLSPSSKSGEVTALDAKQRSPLTLGNHGSFSKSSPSLLFDDVTTTTTAALASLQPQQRLTAVPTHTNIRNPVTPHSLAHAETTFARRLHRTCLERGYYNMSHNLIRPDVFRRKFRLSLLYGTQEQFKAKLRLLLKRDIGESLEWEDHPMILLGGAGTHYPLRDSDGNILARPNAYAVGPAVADGKGTGGHRVKLIKQAEPDTREGRDRAALASKKELIVDISGYEGEWFDPGDVEGYIREKGVELRACDDYAQGEIDDDDGGASLVLDSPTDPFYAEFLNPESMASPPILDKESYVLPPPEDDANSVAWTWPEDSSLSLPTPPAHTDLQAQDFWGAAETFQFPMTRMEPSADVLSNISRRRFMEKKRVTVDVKKLINELCKRGTCLGRTPGFRRKDVDRAFTASIAAF